MKTGRLDCPIDCQVIDNVKAQKSMKSIVRKMNEAFTCLDQHGGKVIDKIFTYVTGRLKPWSPAWEADVLTRRLNSCSH